MSHYEWQVIRKSAGVWTTIGTYFSPDERIMADLKDAAARAKDVPPRSEVRIRRRRVTVHHGAWEDVA